MATNKLNIVTDPQKRTITIRGGSAQIKTASRDGHQGIEIDGEEFIPFPGMQLLANRGPEFGVAAAAH